MSPVAPIARTTTPGIGALGRSGEPIDLAACDTLPGAPKPWRKGLAQGSWVGDYRVEARIGVGGTCEVYCGRGRDGARAALRVPSRTILERSPCFGERLVRTSLWLRRVRHPNLVQVLDHGLTDEPSPRPYQVVELVDGDGLDVILVRDGPKPWRWVVEVVAQLAEALDVLHDAGFIHCDVKPANVMLAAGDAGIRVKLIDYDLAWRIGAPKEPGVCPGTPRYIPPEHALGVRPTRRTDVYSLGVLALELLLGSCPFRDNDFLRLLGSTSSWPRFGDMTLFGESQPDPKKLPERLRSQLRRMTSAQRGRRPRSMSECAKELRSLLAEPQAPKVLVLRNRLTSRSPREQKPRAVAAAAAGALATLGSSTARGSSGSAAGSPGGGVAMVAPLTQPPKGWLLSSVGKVLAGIGVALGLMSVPELIDRIPDDPLAISAQETLDELSSPLRLSPTIPLAMSIDGTSTSEEENTEVETAPVIAAPPSSPRLPAQRSPLTKKQQAHDMPRSEPEPEPEPRPRKRMPYKRVPLLAPQLEAIVSAAPYECPPDPPAQESSCIPADPRPTCIYHSDEGLTTARCVDQSWQIED